MKQRFSRAILLVCLLLTVITFAQEPSQEMHHEHGAPAGNSTDAPQVFFPMANQQEVETPMHHHGQIPEVMPQPPRLGNSQRVVTGPTYQLQDLERMAAEHNPALALAQRAVEAAQANARQSGLYPNPTAGYEGEEIRGGSFGGGEQGFFVEQPIILGGKLGLNRRVGAGTVKQRQADAEAQRQRLANDVSMAFYRTLAAQEKLALELDLTSIAQSTVRVVHQLANVGQADETEVLEAEAEEQRREIAVDTARNKLKREWTILLAVAGVPSLPEGSVAGRIDGDLPALDEGQMLESLLSISPEVQWARAGVERAEAVLARQQHEPIPDLIIKGGLQKNYEQLASPSGRAVGIQGFAEIGLQLHLWDRNQGGIAAARANLDAARNEVNRVELMLRQRSAIFTEDYRTSRRTAERYRAEILPRLEKAYQLMTRQYGNMTASFIRVLTLQRMLYENETAYVDALEKAWTSSIALKGFLLQGGLEAPAEQKLTTDAH